MEKEIRSGTSRRGFLTWLGGFATGATASYFASYLPKLKLPFKTFEYKEGILKPLFMPQDSLRFHYGGAHYLIKGIHSDNAVVGKELIECISNILPVKRENDVTLFELNDFSDWVLIGAPSSNLITREIFGHDLNDVKNRKFVPKNLRYIYGYEDKLVDLVRHTAGGEIQQKAKSAYIKDLKNDNKFRPDEGGWLEEDYLLMTRIKDKKSNNYRTVIGGTHGIGTRGFSLLYTKDPFTKRQKNKLLQSSTSCYQIFAKVVTDIIDGIRVPYDIVIEEVHTW
jgi:hypothetical protein